MQPIRKPFTLDPLFPFDLTYRQLRSTQNELPDHLHDLYEIVYVHEGKGRFFINNVFYDKKPGDVFLIPGNTIHRSFSDADHPIVSTALFFSPALITPDEPNNGYSPLRCFDIARRNNSYNINLIEESDLVVQDTLGEIHTEFQSRALGYRLAIKLCLERLILLINRLPKDLNSETYSKQVGPAWMQDVLRSIDRDPANVGGLSELSAQAYVTPSHFARIFKKMTGMTLNHYITAKKIMKAKVSLQASEDNIETIAAACGFTSLPMFYQKFRAFTGMTPREYRNRE